MSTFLSEPERASYWHRSTSREADALISHEAYNALNNELFRNERQMFQTTSMTDSVHTEFQEYRDSDTATLVETDRIDYANRTSEPEEWQMQTHVLHEGVDEYDPPPPMRNTYMGRTSPFSLEHTDLQDESQAPTWYPEGKATLSFPEEEDGKIVSIHNVNLNMIEERSQLLAAAFESSQSGPRLYLETLSSETAIPFLRFLYTGSYSVVSDFQGDVPTSVLLHCRIYRLGVIYDLTELKSQAYLNVLRQCEFGCSSPDKPIDLCAAIRFCYKHLTEHENLIDAIVHYCVECFLSHHLAEDATFRQLAFELRPFHQALCRNVMNRDFQDEAASKIIQLPFDPHIPATYASREDFSRVGDVVYHFHSNEDVEGSSSKRKRGNPAPQEKIEHGRLHDMKLAQSVPASRVSSLTLALRPRKNEDAVTDDSASEEEGLRVIRRRRSSKVAESSSSAQTSLSDDDFQIVQAPGQVEALSSGDDSDTETVVDEERGSGSVATLPVRPLTHAENAAGAELDPFGDASDPEWDIV